MINFLLGLCVGVMLTFLTLFIAEMLKEPAIDDPGNSAGPPPSAANIVCAWCGFDGAKHAPWCRKNFRRYQLGNPGNRYDV